MRNKTFDCVEMKRKGARKVYEALKGKTRDEQVEYWRARNSDLQAWLESRKTAVSSPSAGKS